MAERRIYGEKLLAERAVDVVGRAWRWIDEDIVSVREAEG